MYLLGFHDESGISEKPTVRRTWSVKGKTPIIQSTGSWTTMSLSGTIVCTVKGNNPKLFLKSLSHNIKFPDVITYLKELKKHLKRKKLLLFWDGLSAHKAKDTITYLKTQKHWLKVERLPAYAPELNPPEYLWSAMKNKHLCNLRPKGLPVLKAAVSKSYRKIRNDRGLLQSFLRASGLYGEQYLT